VFAGYNNFFPVYGAEPQGCGGCGECNACCDAPCAPAACGNPLPLSVFQGPNGCAPAYTIQGPPGLVGPQGPTGFTGPTGAISTFVFNAANSTIQTVPGAQNKFTYAGTFLRIFHNGVGPVPPTSNILSTTFSAPGYATEFSGNESESGYFTTYIDQGNSFRIIVPTTTINQVDVSASNSVYNVIVNVVPTPSWTFSVYYF